MIQVPDAETVLAIRSGVGTAAMPVAFITQPEHVIYARCAGAHGSLEIRADGDGVHVPCDVHQIRRLIASGATATTITVTADPSLRWTVVVTRPADMIAG